MIPCYNAEKHVARCLEALGEQTVERHRYEIVVVDDGSGDRTSTIAAPLCDRLIRITNSGPASARNKGVAESSGDLILFTDSDCVPQRDWIEKMIEPFGNAEVAGVKGAYRTEQARWVARFVQAEYEFKYRRMAKLRFIDFVDTYAAAFRRTVFLELGGFDERFPGASVEDQEFSFRLAEAGFRMVFVPDAIVFHHHADTLAWYFRKKKNIGYWKVMVLRRHPGKIVADSHTPQSLKLQLPLAFLLGLSVIAIPVTGLVLTGLCTLLFLLSGLPEILHCYAGWGIVSAARAPIALWVRSMGLGLGLISGFLGAFGDNRPGN